MENILELTNVTKTYAESGFSLGPISFALPCGGIMGLVGENGAGKSTTIGCILNTLARDGGTIRVFGRELSDQDTALREDIGVVFDGDNFPAYLTAAQLAKILGGVYRRWDDGLFSQYLTRFRLNPRQEIGAYSRGMTMKLAMAAALSHHPRLLILDEATGGLDPVMREEMLDVFLEFVGREDHAILLSSHITTDLEKVADYITFIHDGRLILTASKDDLLYRYAIVRCGESQFAAIDPADILAWRRRAYQIDILVSDGRRARETYKDMVIDQTTIDEIMLLLIKGEGK